MTELKAKCHKCKNMATWYYAPNSSYPQYCNNCIPRGCSCNEWPLYLSEKITKSLAHTKSLSEFKALVQINNAIKEYHFNNMTDEDFNNTRQMIEDDFKNKRFGDEAGATYLERDWNGKEFPCIEWEEVPEGIEDTYNGYYEY